MTKDSSENKAEGQFHSVKGNVNEAIGNLTGSTDWKQSGNKEHAEGEAQYKTGQTQGWVEGLTDRAQGFKDSVVGAITGDQAQQTSGNVQKEAGRAEQKINK